MKKTLKSAKPVSAEKIAKMADQGKKRFSFLQG